MALRSRSSRQIEWEKVQERLNTIRIQLWRANNPTCPECVSNGNAITCPTCGGSGFIGHARPTGAHGWLADPFSTLYVITGDIQTGRGLYGAPNNTIRVQTDLGRIEDGDAMMFTKVYDVDHRTGLIIFPKVDPSLKRPDVVIDRFGDAYTVHKDLTTNIGDDTICRAFALLLGLQGGG